MTQALFQTIQCRRLWPSHKTEILTILQRRLNRHNRGGSQKT